MRQYLLLLPVITLLAACNGCGGSGKKSDLKFFRYNQSSGLASLDPAFAKDQSTIWPCNQLYNSLVQLDDNLNTQPSIAKSWTISEDGKTYTFILRNDVKFHDNACFTDGKGRTVIASDVVYSFNRIVDRKIASPGAWIFNNSIDTTQAFMAINDTTFQLKLSKPFRPMLGILTMQYCSVIPHEAVEKYGVDFRRNPVGTGPFMYKNWKEGTALILVKNPNYFERDEQGSGGIDLGRAGAGDEAEERLGQETGEQHRDPECGERLRPRQSQRWRQRPAARQRACGHQ